MWTRAGEDEEGEELVYPLLLKGVGLALYSAREHQLTAHQLKGEWDNVDVFAYPGTGIKLKPIESAASPGSIM